MKRLYSARDFSQDASRLFTIHHELLSERDIIELQDKFLTNGFHYITVSSIACGRALVKTFLASLSCYTTIGYVSIAARDVQDRQYKDIYDDLISNGYIDSLTGHLVNQQSLDQFFIEEFHYDFIWIEATQTLTEKQWFADFKERLTTFNIDKDIPILMLTR